MDPPVDHGIQGSLGLLKAEFFQNVAAVRRGHERKRSSRVSDESRHQDMTFYNQHVM